MKIAIIHDYLVADGGAEKCLKAFIDIFPEADVYALFCDRNRFNHLSRRKIQTTFLDKMPFLKKNHYVCLPLYSLAVESIILKNYDVILSSSWGWSKAVRYSNGRGFFDEILDPIIDSGEIQLLDLRKQIAPLQRLKLCPKCQKMGLTVFY